MAPALKPTAACASARRIRLSALLLGVALGGFFDGVVLHQILQWHHLLSLVDGVDSLRAQILWDGYFHAAMYVLAAVALAGLWLSRDRADSPSPASLGGQLLAGFGVWHVLDAILSHWILGIHRIRLDAANPLAWDVGWLVVFGLLPLATAWMIARRRPAGRMPTPLLVLLTIGALGGGIWSAQPPSGQTGTTTVVFAAHVTPERAVRAIADTGGGIIWATPDFKVTVVRTPPGRAWSFYGRGALLVSGAGVPAGCAAWVAR